MRTSITTNRNTGVYVHIPFCRSRCSYCSFVSSAGQYDENGYVQALCREIGERVRGNVDSVFVGGGTPSVLSRGLLSRIFDSLRKSAKLSSDCEITVEANPDSCTDAFMDEIVACGVNRLSLGVQSLNDTVLACAGRRHTAAQALQAIVRAQRHGMRNINCDLMLGLPCQTVRDVQDAVNTLADSGVMHLSAYALSVEEGTPLFVSGYALNEDGAADMYDAAYECLRAHGFARYEVSNFCRNGFRCRHNEKYWTLAPYVGVGVAAHSFDGTCRSRNTSDIAAYISGNRGEQREERAAADALEEYIMLGLRTDRGVSYAVLNELYGGDWQQSKHDTLQMLLEKGLLVPTLNGVRLGERAYYTMNDIIVRLL